ncbi:MAG: signal peptidase I [bacterium]|nr:signal peptidase I [bacterium]
MEEDKTIKKKRLFKKIGQVISYTLIVILMIIASFLMLYIITCKIATKKHEIPPFGLYTIISPSMVPSINVYDVILIKKVETSDLKVGDIITFKSTNNFFGNTPITHRIVEILDTEDGIRYEVKGDANAIEDEEKVIPENIYGKVVLRIPSLGKIQFFLTSKKGWIAIILVPTILIIVYDIYKIINLIKLRKELNEYQ